LPQNGGKFGCFYIETVLEVVQKLRFLNNSIQLFRLCGKFFFAVELRTAQGAGLVAILLGKIAARPCSLGIKPA
jgi:hypothetical protein